MAPNPPPSRLASRHSGRVLRELGYVEGKNIVVEIDTQRGKADLRA